MQPKPPPTPLERAERWVQQRFEGVGWIRVDPSNGDTVVAEAVRVLSEELESEFIQCEQEVLEFLARMYGPPFEDDTNTDVRMIRELMRERRSR